MRPHSANPEVVGAQHASVTRYRSRIIKAEVWAAERNRIARNRARASFHVPAIRTSRYANLQPWFIDRLSASEVERVERALQVVLEAIETDVYGLPREPVPEDIAMLVAEGFAACDS